MAFKQKYDILKDYLPAGTKRRPGGKIQVRFIVAHDSGNPGSTAKGNINYYRNTPTIAASAQIFNDDKEIRECIPALTGTPERAYHVIYDVTTDNKMFGDDANDIAIGVEYCWGGKINATESYKRYVWVLAYLCYKFGLDPARDIVGHDTLDPKRKIDPTNGLKKSVGLTFAKLISDVKAEYKECTGTVAKPQPASVKVGETHVIKEGDTLYAIATDYNTTVAKLKSLNPEIDVNALQIGGVLVINPTAKAVDYKIVKGDTLWEIASKFDTTVDKLKALNPKINPDALVIGSTIKVESAAKVETKAKAKAPAKAVKKTSPKADDLEHYLSKAPIRKYPGKAVGKASKYINSGKDVEAVQRALGVSVDGKFGAKTETAVKKYQAKFPFLGEPDGIVGKNTWHVMF